MTTGVDLALRSNGIKWCDDSSITYLIKEQPLIGEIVKIAAEGLDKGKEPVISLYEKQHGYVWLLKGEAYERFKLDEATWRVAKLSMKAFLSGYDDILCEESTDSNTTQLKFLFGPLAPNCNRYIGNPFGDYDCKPSGAPHAHNRRMQHFLQSFKDQWRTDITIMCKDGKTFGAHSLILGSMSEALRGEINFPGKEKNQITFREDIELVKVFIEYLYDEQDPFVNDNPHQIDPLELFAIANRYQVKSLMYHCLVYLFENMDPKEWEQLGRAGDLYDSKEMLLQYNKYRLERLGVMSEQIRKACVRVGIPTGPLVPKPSLAAKVVIRLNWGNQFCLGIRSAHNWNITQFFSFRDRVQLHHTWGWDDNNNWGSIKKEIEIRQWDGSIPLGEEFKFVRVGLDGSLTWETRRFNRLISDENRSSKEPLTITDISFEPIADSSS